MIERTWDVERINEVTNDPSVFPWICGPLTSAIDFRDVVFTPGNVILFGEHGGFIFYRMTEHIYDAHSAVLPDGRGKWALQTACDALAWMFNKTPAEEIMMSVPRGNLAVRALVRRLKAKLRGPIEDGWWLNGKPTTIDVYSLTKDEWQCL